MKTQSGKGGKNVPSTQIDHDRFLRDMFGNLRTVGLEKFHLVGGLIVLRRENDLGPDGEPLVIVQELIGKNDGASFRGVVEGVTKTSQDRSAHGRTSNVDDSTMGDVRTDDGLRLLLLRHGDCIVWGRCSLRVQC